MIPDSQLARDIQSKSVQGFEMEPSLGGMGLEDPYEPGGLGGKIKNLVIFFRNFVLIFLESSTTYRIFFTYRDE